MTPTQQDVHAELFRVGSRGGGRFRDPGDLFESIIEEIYRSVLSVGDLVVDGGAHVGRHAFPMAERVGKSGLVLAAEAHPRLARELVKRARKRAFPQVHVVPAALADRVGRVSFHCVVQHPAYSGIRARRYDFDDDVEIVAVEATTVDALLADHPARRLRFVKLDLEGGEFRALEGAKAALKRDRPLIIFENDQDRSAASYEYTREEWFGLFDSLSYEIWTLWGKPYGPEDWGRRDIPWYFIAAPAAAVETNVFRERLPGILAMYYSLL